MGRRSSSAATYVEMKRAKLDFSAVRRVGMDETAAARRRDYVSFTDPAGHRVLFAAGAATLPRSPIRRGAARARRRPGQGG